MPVLLTRWISRDWNSMSIRGVSAKRSLPAHPRGGARSWTAGTRPETPETSSLDPGQLPWSRASGLPDGHRAGARRRCPTSPARVTWRRKARTSMSEPRQLPAQGEGQPYLDFEGVVVEVLSQAAPLDAGGRGRRHHLHMGHDLAHVGDGPRHRRTAASAASALPTSPRSVTTPSSLDTSIRPSVVSRFRRRAAFTSVVSLASSSLWRNGPKSFGRSPAGSNFSSRGPRPRGRAGRRE